MNNKEAGVQSDHGFYLQMKEQVEQRQSVVHKG